MLPLAVRPITFQVNKAAQRAVYLIWMYFKDSECPPKFKLVVTVNLPLLCFQYLRCTTTTNRNLENGSLVPFPTQLYCLAKSLGMMHARILLTVVAKLSPPMLAKYATCRNYINSYMKLIMHTLINCTSVQQPLQKKTRNHDCKNVSTELHEMYKITTYQ